MLLFILLFFSQLGFTNEFNQIAANASEISAAPCFVPYPSEEFSFSDYFAKLNQDSLKQTRSVGGVEFQSAPVELIMAYRSLTSHVNYKLAPIMDIDFWELFKDSRCTDPVCAAKEVFGETKGELFLAIQSLTGINLSHLGYSRLQPPIFEGESKASSHTLNQFNAMYAPEPWQLAELEVYLQALLNLPASLFPLSPNTRLLKNKYPHWQGRQVHANAAITLYPAINETDSLYKIYTLVHEIGHIVGAAKGVDLDRRWVDFSWEIQRNQVVRKPQAQFISLYASQDYFEDFAESFAAYRFIPERLKAFAPKKYEYLRDFIFEGQEYLSGEVCPPPIGAALGRHAQ